MSARNIDKSRSRSPVLRHIGIASAIGIVLVVFGHSLPPHLQYPDNDHFAKFATIIINFIYTFHMPLFFCISGYLYVHTNQASRQRGYGSLVKNKAVRLLLPYIVLGTMAFVPKIMLAEYAKNPIEPTWGFYIDSLLYPWLNSIRFFWFLPTLFALFIIAPILLRSLYFSNCLLARFFQIMLFGVFVWLNLNFEHYVDPPSLFNYNGILHNVIYFWLGIWMYPLFEGVVKRQTEKPMLYYLAFSIVIFTISIIIYTVVTHNAFTTLLNAILGIAATIILALALSNIQQKYLQWLDRYSYQVYLLSFFFQVPIQLAMYHLWGTPSSTVLIASFFTGLSGPLIIVLIVTRYRLPGRVIVGL